MVETALVKSLSDIETDRETLTIAEQVVNLHEKSNVLAVYDETTSKAAAEIRLEGQRLLKMLETRRKFFVDPHNAFVKTINAFYKEPSDMVAGVIQSLGQKLVQYSDKVDAEKRALEAKIFADKRTLPETKSAKIAAVPEAPKVVRSETGSTGFRIDKRLEIYAPSDLPREYLIPDEKFILAALKAGKTIPGARLIDVKVPVGRSAF